VFYANFNILFSREVYIIEDLLKKEKTLKEYKHET